MSPDTLNIIRLAIELALACLASIFGAKFTKWKSIVKQIIDILYNQLSKEDKEKLPEDVKVKINTIVGKKIL